MANGVRIKSVDLSNVIKAISSVTKQERKLIRDLPEQFRRMRLHTDKLVKLRSLLEKSLDKGGWVEKDKIFSLIEELLKEINSKKGVITQEVYLETEFSKLVESEKAEEEKRTQITFELYDKLDKKLAGAATIPSNTKTALSKIKNRIKTALSDEKIRVQVDTHVENLLAFFKENIALQKERLQFERKALINIKEFKEEVFITDILKLKLNSEIKELKGSIKFLKENQVIIRDHFYTPFRKFTDEIPELEKVIDDAITGKRKLFGPETKLSSKDFLLDYKTLTNPQEVLQYFKYLKWLGPEFVEQKVLNRIISLKDKVERKQKRELSGLKRTVLELSADPLTGALLKGALKEEMRDLISVSKSDRVKFSVVFIDADKFKSINDEYGHGNGDKILIFVTSIIKKEIRDNDKLFRYGGEEFIVSLPGVSKGMGVDVAERIRNKIHTVATIRVKKRDEEIEQEGPNGERINIYKNLKLGQPISISCGVATFPDDCDITFDQLEKMNLDDAIKTDLTAKLLDKADKALYKAKKGGRNKVVPA